MNYALAYECHKKTTVQMNKSYDLYRSQCRWIGLSESLPACKWKQLLDPLLKLSCNNEWQSTGHEIISSHKNESKLKSETFLKLLKFFDDKRFFFPGQNFFSWKVKNSRQPRFISYLMAVWVAADKLWQLDLAYMKLAGWEYLMKLSVYLQQML